MTTLNLRKSISRSLPLITYHCSLITITLALACFALWPTPEAFGVSPPPDGGYAGANTAEGHDALFNLTDGMNNTALGFEALYNNTDGAGNTATGVGALRDNTTGADNTATGDSALHNNGRSVDNTATGFDALHDNTSGDYNTANGYQALYLNTHGHDNTADGILALYSNTGSYNTATGDSALFNNTHGNDNTALGFFAGGDLTTGSNNIDIDNRGVAGESDTIRFGTEGTQTNTFIAGISGVTVAGGVGVIIDTNGHLGTVVSSERFKDGIKPIDKASEAILALKPVTFRYKHELDPDSIPQFGLVAEQVEKVDPNLVARDSAGKPYTVRYEAVNAMLLNEFLKEHRKVEEQDRKLQEQEATMTQLKFTVAQQQKGMESLAATLKEQASQIQRVTAQLELRKPAPQTVANNQ